MSRYFDGLTFGSPEHITFSAGNSPNVGGPITIATLFKGESSKGWLSSDNYYIQGYTATNAAIWGMLTVPSGQPFIENMFSGSPFSLVADKWQWLVATKPGISAPARFHAKNVTDNELWQHASTVGNIPNFAVGVPANIVIGASGSTGLVGGRLRGWIALTAVWNTEFNDAAVEATFTNKAIDVANNGPLWGVIFPPDQILTDAVQDFTGGGGNQNGRLGTTVSFDDPPEFDYSLVSGHPISPTPPERKISVSTESRLRTVTASSRMLFIPKESRLTTVDSEGRNVIPHL